MSERLTFSERYSGVNVGIHHDALQNTDYQLDPEAVCNALWRFGMPTETEKEIYIVGTPSMKTKVPSTHELAESAGAQLHYLSVLPHRDTIAIYGRSGLQPKLRDLNRTAIKKLRDLAIQHGVLEVDLDPQYAELPLKERLGIRGTSIGLFGLAASVSSTLISLAGDQLPVNLDRPLTLTAQCLSLMGFYELENLAHDHRVKQFDDEREITPEVINGGIDLVANDIQVIIKREN